jgi:hypothetical protein
MLRFQFQQGSTSGPRQTVRPGPTVPANEQIQPPSCSVLHMLQAPHILKWWLKGVVIVSCSFRLFLNNLSSDFQQPTQNQFFWIGSSLSPLQFPNPNITKADRATVILQKQRPPPRLLDLGVQCVGIRRRAVVQRTVHCGHLDLCVFVQ